MKNNTPDLEVNWSYSFSWRYARCRRYKSIYRHKGFGWHCSNLFCRWSIL